jgi:hypothetical protein
METEQAPGSWLPACSLATMRTAVNWQESRSLDVVAGVMGDWPISSGELSRGENGHEMTETCSGQECCPQAGGWSGDALQAFSQALDTDQIGFDRAISCFFRGPADQAGPLTAGEPVSALCDVMVL